MPPEPRRRYDAALAVGRSQVESADQVSLSPASILSARPMERLVLPSPNGSAISTGLAAAGATVVGACLRNRTAVADWAGHLLTREPDRALVVVAAGERWADASLRPAVEDLWGAGAVLAALSMDRCSPEACTAAAAFEAVDGLNQGRFTAWGAPGGLIRVLRPRAEIKDEGRTAQAREPNGPGAARWSS